MSFSLGTRRTGRRRHRLALLVVVSATVVLAIPVSAQSASPAPAAISPAAGSPAPIAPSGLVALKDSFAAAICDPLLSAAEVSATAGVTATIGTGVRQAPLIVAPGFIQLFCTWQVDGGSIALHVLDQYWPGKGKPKAKDHLIAQLLDHHGLPGATKLAGLGDVAYTEPGDTASHRSPKVTWAVYVKHGTETADRELKLSGDIDPAVLQTLAAAVRSDATPGDPPTAVPPGAAAAPLIGTWALTGWDLAEPAFPASPGMTFTFDDAGTLHRAFDCDPPKGQVAPLASMLYFVDGNAITTVSDLSPSVGACPDSMTQDQFTKGVISNFVINALDATWAVDGDKLSISGTIGAAGQQELATLTFERVAG